MPSSKVTLLNIIGARVLVSKASVSCSAFTSPKRVNFGDTPALLKRTFKPLSFTMSDTCFTKFG